MWLVNFVNVFYRLERKSNTNLFLALEAMDPEDTSTLDVEPRTKQTVQMLVRDLNTVRKLAALCRI